MCVLFPVLCCCCAPGLELIAEGLAHNGSVLCLDLSDNAITSVGAVELAEALHGESCKVAELLLDKNRICECTSCI